MEWFKRLGTYVLAIIIAAVLLDIPLEIYACHVMRSLPPLPPIIH